MPCKLFVVFVLLITSCSSRGPKTAEKSMDALNEQFITALQAVSPQEDPKLFKAYVLIPNTGCTGCISAAEDMLKRSVEKANGVRYILTNIESLKMLSYKVGFDVTGNKKIIIDRQNYFNSGVLKSIYPQILIINKQDGRISDRLEVSPQEDGLKLLKEKYFID